MSSSLEESSTTRQTTEATSQPSRAERWETQAEWLLACVAAIFLAAYSVDVLVQPTGVLAAIVTWVTGATWVVFAIDYVLRLAFATDRKRWILTHPFQLAVVALPFLRPLLLVRLFILVGVLQVAVGNAIRGRVIAYAISGSVLLVYVASLAVLAAERNYPEAHIQHFGDALWWAMTTITTVGYGDMYPVSTEGRFIAVLLMIGGISLVGSITATLASWIVQRVAEGDDSKKAATSYQVDALRDEVRQLKELLAPNDSGERRASPL